MKKPSLIDKMSQCDKKSKKVALARIDKDLHEKVTCAMEREGDTWVRLIESACAIYLFEVSQRGTSKVSK